MMKKNIWLAIVLLLLMVTGIHASELPDFPFVFAEGKANIKIKPDIAKITFYVEQFDAKAENALNVVQERSEEILSFFDKQNITKEAIYAFEINKRAVRKTENYTELSILSYEVSRYFTVKLKNLKNYEPLVHKLLTLKNVVKIRTTFDRVDRKQIEADLVAKACRNARSQAEIMAKGFNAKLGKVFAVSQEGFENLKSRFVIGGIRRIITKYSSSEFMFVPSTITIRNTVYVIFKLK